MSDNDKTSGYDTTDGIDSTGITDTADTTDRTLNYVGYVIRKIRTERGMSLRAFANLVGLSHGYVRMLESGEGLRV